MTIFSLIVPTLGRTDELGRLLASIRAQRLVSFSLSEIEIIVIDQNVDDRLKPILAALPDLPITLHRIPSKGLSHAKNQGLVRATGRIVAFPDDDCWLPENLLESVYGELQSAEFQKALIIRAEDPALKKPLLRYPFHRRVISATTKSSAFLGVQIGQFYPAGLLRGLCFDERFGVGSSTSWGSGEDTDFLLNVLARGHEAIFVPHLSIYHPWVGAESMTREKARFYALGFGALCAKHGLTGHWIGKVFLQLAKAIFHRLSRRKGTAKIAWITARSRFQGYLQFRHAPRAVPPISPGTSA